jgi:hypothetical protein
LTYVIKSVDRPSIQPTVEELNQYNKKRQIYTGYKKSPVKCVFYDDGASSALSMWADYTKYYFGDFSATAGASGPFQDDITGTWSDSAGGFGFTAKNGGGASGRGSQFYFSSIDILHIHGTSYDLYTLVNPRIASFTPDELDYEQAAVATISAEFAYEALIFKPNQAGAASQPEFRSFFNGETDKASPNASDVGTPTAPNTPTAALGGLFAGVEQLFGGGASPTLPNASPDYRYFSSAVGSGLGIFGSFGFGMNPNGVPGSSSPFGSTLLGLASGNPMVSAALGVGRLSGNPLATSSPLGFYTQQNAYGGVPAQYGNNYNAIAGATSGYGPSGIIAAAETAASAITGHGSTGSALKGLALSTVAYSVLNATRPGSAQYGYNPSVTPDGYGYGYQGPDGVPVIPESQLYQATEVSPPNDATASQGVYQPAITDNGSWDVADSSQPTTSQSASTTSTPITTPVAESLPTPPIPPTNVPAAANPDTTDDGAMSGTVFQPVNSSIPSGVVPDDGTA